ncbi:SMI1/KNR4 family protein [Iodobacter sp. BJB302]|uniref:SMI1/KNR4 family protein n=1 Tax=Iodobacter sp. BJB302 TaxID=1506510 RepID=UPI0035B50785
MFEIAETAWGQMGVAKKWLPFIEDNSDYFLLSQTGEVKYWSHNGNTNEKWPNFAMWFQQVCMERR